MVSEFDNDELYFDPLTKFFVQMVPLLFIMPQN